MVSDEEKTSSSEGYCPGSACSRFVVETRKPNATIWIVVFIDHICGWKKRNLGDDVNAYGTTYAKTLAVNLAWPVLWHKESDSSTTAQKEPIK